MRRGAKWIGSLLACALLLSGCGEQPPNENPLPQENQPSQENQLSQESQPSQEDQPSQESQPAPASPQQAEPGDTYKTYLFDADTTYQVMDGFGAAYTWYANWVNNTDNPAEVMDALFTDARLTVLRFKNEYNYWTQGSAPNVNTMVQYYFAARERAAEYGEDVQVLLCCWSPPAYLKEGGDITGSASLRRNDDGEYCYEEYASWWADAITYYQDYGIKVDYVSIQNEVEFAASYDGCVFAPKETEELASFEKAYLAVYDELQQRFGEDAPKMLGPETMSCRYGDILPYMRNILAERPETVYGIAHHLYVGGDGENEANTVTPSSFTSQFMSLQQAYGDIARWQTEYYVGHAIDTATVINNALVYEDLNCYLYWSGVWEDSTSDFEGGYLIGVNNWGSTSWRRKADYYALRHFSEFIRPGYARIDTKSRSLAVSTSGFISPQGDKVALVLINNGEEELQYRLEPAHYAIASAVVYQSVFGDTCLSEEGLYRNLGDIGADGVLTLPAKSVTSVDISGEKQ